MILRLEIISSTLSYVRKNMIFHENIVKLTKNNTFNNVFVIKYFPSVAILSSILNVKFSVAKIVKTNCFKKTFFLNKNIWRLFTFF